MRAEEKIAMEDDFGMRRATLGMCRGLAGAIARVTPTQLTRLGHGKSAPVNPVTIFRRPALTIRYVFCMFRVARALSRRPTERDSPARFSHGKATCIIRDRVHARYVSRQFSRPFDKVWFPRREIIRPQRTIRTRMNNMAIRLSALRNSEERDGASVTSGDGVSSNGIGDPISRAALFRLEADALRQRACATDETVIRDQYFKLADHWSMLAVGLEVQFLTELTEPPLR
jgi:hypothetical protein